MVARAYGRSLSDDEIEDVYSAAWAATLSALKTRGPRMDDGELRAYLLTAVASHASKELRRRSRKPSSPLEATQEQVFADSHLPLPDEIVIGSEARGVARDLLTSLPPRRRAVMLLRYGWGLSPKEVCALVTGLSPRAYRKEVTQGVDQLIERLRQVETGEWCESRESLIRDLVAGTADEATRQQALKHLSHCRACSDLAAQLSGHLHEIGGMVAFSAVAGSIGGGGIAVLGRIGDLLNSGREVAGSVATSGGLGGAGAAGTGALAKMAGLGGLGKAAIACAGAGAAATACVAAGVIPGMSLPDFDGSDRNRAEISRADSTPPSRHLGPRRTVASVETVGNAVASNEVAQAAPEPSANHHEPANAALPVQPDPPEPVPTAVQEFDPVVAQAAPPTEAGSSSSTAQTSSGTGAAAPATSVAEDEFGP